MLGFLMTAGMTWPALAMAVMPLIALGAATLGFFAVRDASRPDRFGRGPAKLALFVGAALFVLESAAVGAAGVTYIHHARTLAPAVDIFVESLASGDTTTAVRSTTLDPGTAETGEDLARWQNAVRTRLGELDGARFTLGTIAAARHTASELPPTVAANTGPPPRLVELVGDRDSCVVWVYLDEAALEDGRVVIDDLLALLGRGDAAALRRDGPAAQAAADFGLTLTSGSP